MAESTIIMSKQANRLDPAIKKKAFAFLEKLSEDDASPGLHIEPINNSLDRRVRTGRVDQGYRAVLFKLTADGANAYVFHGIWPHDDAIEVAKKTTLSVNPVNGIAEIRSAEADSPSVLAQSPVDMTKPSAESMPSARPAVVPTETQAATAPAQGSHLPEPWHFPADPSDMASQLGLPHDVIDAALALPNEDALLDFAAQLPGWQGQALVDLAAGLTVQEVKAQLSIVEPDTSTDTQTDESILAGLHHPAARMEFAEMAGADELRRVIEVGDFSAWKVFLHPQQRGVVAKHFNGSARVSGGAGTGKTVVVLHRARWLAKEDSSARIVITTFTRNLAEALASDLAALDPTVPIAPKLGEPGVFVTGIDSLAAAVLRSAGKEIESDFAAVLGQSRPSAENRTTNSEGQWRAAIDSVGDLDGSLRSAAFMEAEYSLVILPARITTLADYLRVRRPGRGVRLSRPQRTAVWSCVEAYRQRGRLAGAVDFEEAAAIAANHLEKASSAGRVADHVLVDEGQDLSPCHWQLLRALVEPGPDDLFIAEDGQQRIYGHRLTLARFDIRTVGRSRRLSLNYRTTAENLAYAVGVLGDGDFPDLEGESGAGIAQRSARRGPSPVVRTFEDLQAGAEFMAATIERWLTADPAAVPETIALLVRDRFQRDRMVGALGDMGVTIRGVDREAIKPGHPVALTMHRAKGTEFANVILCLGDERQRSDAFPSELDRNEAEARDRSLIYVAASRARDELVVTRVERHH